MPPKIKLNLKKAGPKPVHQQANNKFLQEKYARQQREQQDKEEAAKVYEDFIESFEKNEKGPQKFVRGGTIQEGKSAVSSAFGDDEDDDDEEGDDETGRTQKRTSKASNDTNKQKQEGKDLETREGVGTEMEKMMQQMKKRVAEPSRETTSSRESRKSKTQDSRKTTKQTSVSGSSKRPPKVEKKGRKREIDKLMEEIEESGGPDAPSSRKDSTVTTPSGKRIVLPDGDPNSTNIYVGNLAPTITEEFLSKTFGKFGDLISVKVMWPRTDEEKARGRNTGFVAFDTREQAVDAMASMWDSEIAGQRIKLGWGKPIKGASETASATPASSKPPRKRSESDTGRERARSESSTSSSGTEPRKKRGHRRSHSRGRNNRRSSSSSSNSHNRSRSRSNRGGKRKRSRSYSSDSDEDDRERHRDRRRSGRSKSTRKGYSSSDGSESSARSRRRRSHRKRHKDHEAGKAAEKQRIEMDRLYGGPAMPEDAPQIVVQPPSDPLRRRHIDRLALYVSKDAQALEDVLISAEKQNWEQKKEYNYSFLFDNHSAEGIYYRWKVISLLMGDSVKSWRTKPFQLTAGGPFWIPPPMEDDHGDSKKPQGDARYTDTSKTQDRVETQRGLDENDNEESDPRVVEERQYVNGLTFDPQPPQVLSTSTERYKIPKLFMPIKPNNSGNEVNKAPGRRRITSESRGGDKADAETDIDEAWDSGRSWSSSDSDCPIDEDKGNECQMSVTDNIPVGHSPLTHKEFRKWVRSLRRLNLQRDSIRDAMVWALDHSSKARPLIDVLRQSLVKRTSPAPVKVARLYLVNDILHNSTAAVRNASVFRNAIQEILPYAFEELGWTLRQLHKYAGRITAEAMKNRIQRVLRRWETIGVFPPLFIHGLEASLLWRADAQMEASREWEDVDETSLDLDDLRQKCRQAGQQYEGLNGKAMLKRLSWVNQFIKKKFGDVEDEASNSRHKSLREDTDGNVSKDNAAKRKTNKSGKKRRNKYAARAGKGSWVSIDASKEQEEGEDDSDDTDSDVDGVPLDVAGNQGDQSHVENTASTTGVTPSQANSGKVDQESSSDEDVDGVPLDNVGVSAPQSSTAIPAVGAAGSVTEQKVGEDDAMDESDSDENVDGVPV